MLMDAQRLKGAQRRGIDDPPGEASVLAANCAASGDVAPLPAVRHPSAVSDSSRHSAVPSSLYRKLHTINRCGCMPAVPVTLHMSSYAAILHCGQQLMNG
jgi:hypothetical protein